MNQTQWLWEYQSLIEREKQETDKVTATLKAFRLIMVQLLGLDLLIKDPPLKEGEQPTSKNALDDVRFIPMSILTGRREIVEAILKELKNSATEEQATSDEEFEKLSASMAKGEDLGDMEPMINPDSGQLSVWNRQAQLRELERLGVKITERGPSNVSHINFDAKHAASRVHAEAQKRQDAEEALAAAREALSKGSDK